MVPVIVQQQDNTGLRAAVVIVGVLILGLAIAYSKKQRPEDQMVPTESATPAPAQVH
jgi:hypothetical protein